MRDQEKQKSRERQDGKRTDVSLTKKPLSAAMSATLGGPPYSSPSYPQVRITPSVSAPTTVTNPAKASLNQPSTGARWEMLVAELRVLIDRLSTGPDTEILAQFENMVLSLKACAAEELAKVAEQERIEGALRALEARCQTEPLLGGFLDELAAWRASWFDAPAAMPLRWIEEKILTLADTFGDYCRTCDEIRVKKARITELERMIDSAPVAGRQVLRQEAARHRSELNEPEQALSALEQAVANLLSPVRKPSDNGSTSGGLADVRLADTAAPAVDGDCAPAQSLSTVSVSSESSAEGDIESSVEAQDPLEDKHASTETNRMEDASETHSDIGAADSMPGPKTAQPPEAPQPTSSTVDQERALANDLSAESQPEPPGSQSTTPVSVPPDGGRGILEHSPQVPLPLSYPRPATEGPVATLLRRDVASLEHLEWSHLGQIQLTWLAQRQPLRAWLLTSEIERRLTSLDRHIEHFPLLPAWACRLLLVITDTKLQLADEEKELVYRIRALNDQHKELLTLWITAALLQNATDKPLRVVRTVSPKQFDLPSHGLARLCADHLLAPVSQGGSLKPLGDPAVFQQEYEQALQKASDILNPKRNNYQNTWVRTFWRQLIARSGPMQRILDEARERRMPTRTITVEMIVEGVDGWSDVLSTYHNNMQNRMEEFCYWIESARAAYNSIQEAKREDRSQVSKQAINEIRSAVVPRAEEAWWYEAIGAGIANL